MTQHHHLHSHPECDAQLLHFSNIFKRLEPAKSHCLRWDRRIDTAEVWGMHGQAEAERPELQITVSLESSGPASVKKLSESLLGRLMCAPLLSAARWKKKKKSIELTSESSATDWKTNPNLWLITTHWEILATQRCDPALSESWAPYQRWTMCAWVSLAWLCLPHVCDLFLHSHSSHCHYSEHSNVRILSH